MNRDASSATSTSQHSPQGYASGGSDSKSKSFGMSQKRASRAGTRSVTTLSAAQLERKRANDREAQRAIRQRTKDHIEALERRINELTVAHESREKLMVVTQQRNRDLEEENSYLRNRLGNDTFAINVTEVEGKDKPLGDYGVSGPNSSPQPQSHISGGSIVRPSSTSTTRSIPVVPIHTSQHPDSWRVHNTFASAGGPAPTSFLPEAAQANNASNSASWRAQEAGESQSRMEAGSGNFANPQSAPDRSSWIGSAPGYGYQIRQHGRTASYPPTTQPLTYPAASQPPPFQAMSTAPSELPPVTSAFHTSGLVSQGEYQSMAAYATSQQPTFHEHPQPHAAYQVGEGQAHSAGEFHSGTTNVHRNSLAPPMFNAAGGSPQFMHAQPSHRQSLPLAYREGNQHQYGYDT